jgi:two-component system, cell cycle sensor histidine kinase and response regulator CckA
VAAVEQSADLVIITDRGGIIEYINPAFEDLTGYSREDAVGRTPRILKSGQQPPKLYQELWETILAGNVFRGVLANRKKNGQIFYAEKTITPLRDADGGITHFISNDRDITERRRLESQLQQIQKMDAIGRLAGGVAHDFNNLLMVISAYAELMFDSLAGEHPLRRKCSGNHDGVTPRPRSHTTVARLWPQADAISAASGFKSGDSRNKRNAAPAYRRGHSAHFRAR